MFDVLEIIKMIRQKQYDVLNSDLLPDVKTEINEKLSELLNEVINKEEFKSDEMAKHYEHVKL